MERSIALIPIRSFVFILCFWCCSVVGSDICHAFGQRGLILRDHLYFMGSAYVLSDNPNFVNQASLFSLDLKSTFPVEGNLQQSFVSNTSISTTPYMAGGVFWGDLNQTFLYTMAAFADPTTSAQSTIQGYDIENNRWQSISVTGGSFNQYDRYEAMQASSFQGGGTQAFISGGWDYLNGMVIFNSTNPTQPSWQNITDNNLPYFWSPATQYVRFGNAGVLISVGGFITESTSQGVAQRREMNSVQVYDIAAGEWFTIFATGDIPPPRSRTCSALSAAPDDSSFQFILYGGWDEQNALDDIYVLTMPSFTWIKINTTTQSTTSMPRMDHFCTTYGDRQMLVVGGKPELSASKSNEACGNGYSAVRMLDTSTFTWQTRYPLSNTQYQVPQAVIDVVGGGPTGGAKPASAFSKVLGNHASVFSKTVARYDPANPPKPSATSSGSSSPSSTAGSSSDSSSTSSTSSSSSLSSGAIAGIVVGSIVGVGLLAAAAWFFLIRQILRRRQRGNSNEALMGGAGAGGTLPPVQLSDKNNSKTDLVEYRLHEMGGTGLVQLDGTGQVHELDEMGHGGNRIGELSGDTHPGRDR